MDLARVRQELEVITRMIWQPLLKDELQLVPEIPEEHRIATTRGASVHILGGWFGSVSVECTVELSRTVAARMLGTDEEQLAEEDWSSVLKELTNITGGNIKALLGHNCILSTPGVWAGEDWTFAVPETEERLALVYAAEGEHFIVRLHQGRLDLSGL